MTNNWEDHIKQKIIEPKDLESKVRQIKEQGFTIATLNGSFDILHAGHIKIIFEASKAADKLIMALNSDSSIKTYKCKTRPIIPLEYRLQMVAALEYVDFVTWFSETDPRKLLGIVKPDVHVNGSEYGENCPEADTVKLHGGKLHIVDLVPGLSTSGIIKKIMETCD